MGKRKRLVKELEAALSQTLSDWAIERQANRSLREVIANDRQRHEMVVNAMTAGMQRLTEERDEAEKNVAELLRNNEAADSTIGDLHKELEVLGGVASMFERDLATLQAQHSAVSDALDLEREHSAKTIGALRDDLADMRERLDAALTEAARMRKEWTGDVTAAREIIERKSAEIVELRRDVAALRRDYDTAILSWSGTERLLQERERELDALQERHAALSDLLDTMRAGQAQAAHAESAVTLEAIEELEEGERLVDNDGVSIECCSDGYWVEGYSTNKFELTAGDALARYNAIASKRGVKP